MNSGASTDTTAGTAGDQGPLHHVTVVHSKRQRIAALDLLRFVAAILVVFYHLCFRGNQVDHVVSTSFSALWGVARYGRLGVHLFFMVSGFVIFMSAEGRSAASFFQSRFVRLYPAYWAACTLTFAFVNVLHAGPVFERTLGEWVVNLSMVEELFQVRSVDGAYWTLTIELRFYLIVFLVCATGLFDALPILLAAWTGYSWVVQRQFIAPEVSLLYPWSIYFTAGAAFYLLYRRRTPWFALALVAVSAYLSYRELEMGEVDEGRSLSVMTAIMAGLFALFGFISWSRGRSSERPWAYAVGALTYPLYLTHQFIGYAILNKIGPVRLRYVWLAFIVCGLLALAWAVHHFVEIPVARRLRRLFASGGSGPPPPDRPGLRSAQAPASESVS